MKKVMGLLLILVFVLQAGACVDSSKSPGAEYWVRAKAEEFIDLLNNEEFVEAHSYVDSNLALALSPEKIGDIWLDQVDQYGSFSRVERIMVEDRIDYFLVYMICKFEEQDVEAKISVTREGEIQGAVFHPAGILPDVSQDGWIEEEVFIDNGEFVLPGVLTFPKEGGPHPGILLMGSGISEDQDGTLGPNRILRDLAWELADNGIATLRYQRRFTVYPQFTVNSKEYTPEEEYLDDAEAAVQVLLQDARVNTEGVFILGHDFGGTIAPILMERSPEVRGLILMAAPARSMVVSLTDLFDTMMEKEVAADWEKEIFRNSFEKEMELLRQVYGGTLKTNQQSIFGKPVSYWEYLKDYDAASFTEANVHKPIMILQGVRDYESTGSDFDIWKDHLLDHESVFILYPHLNHLFMPGQGEIRPEEYLIPANVDPLVADDIAWWVRSVLENKEE